MLVLTAAVGLTWLFWSKLWLGGGLIGGDLYTYYFPQKVWYAERLAAGEIPLWNPMVAHGYPTVGESQTGVFYPFHLLLYSTLSVNDAYNAEHLLHYVLGFCFMHMLARRLGLSIVAALLATAVFTYGWFPPRACLEWAILGGAWMPLAFFAAEALVAPASRAGPECRATSTGAPGSRSARGSYMLVLAAALAMQMLAGHFHIAFLTQAALAVYVLWRLVAGRARRSGFAVQDARTTGPESRPADSRRSDAGRSACASRPAALAAVGGLVLAYALAAPQLLPSWELRNRSQRAGDRTAESEFRPDYGNTPAWYWPQVVIGPWTWYAGLPSPDAGLSAENTNRIEAHLYFGLVPLVLVLVSIPWTLLGRGDQERAAVGPVWWFLAIAALLYTPGWFLPVMRHVPGFGFFTGPGRYGLITTLAVALLAARGLDGLLGRMQRGVAAWVAGLVLVAVTVLDLWHVHGLFLEAPQETPGLRPYAMIVETPPVALRDASPIARLLAEEGGTARVLARAPNMLSMCDAACVPQYLGIGPREYFDRDSPLHFPDSFDWTDPQTGRPRTPTAEEVHWLREAGVTHVVALEPLDVHGWPVESPAVWSGFDPLLHRALARQGSEPLYLFRLSGARGRAFLSDAGPDDWVRSARLTANRVVVTARVERPQELVLRELAYPGWQVEVDGRGRPALQRGALRAVALEPGEHEVVWSYRPASVCWGSGAAAAAVIVVVGVAVVGWRKAARRR